MQGSMQQFSQGAPLVQLHKAQLQFLNSSNVQHTRWLRCCDETLLLIPICDVQRNGWCHLCSALARNL